MDLFAQIPGGVPEDKRGQVVAIAKAMKAKVEQNEQAAKERQEELLEAMDARMKDSKLSDCAKESLMLLRLMLEMVHAIARTANNEAMTKLFLDRVSHRHSSITGLMVAMATNGDEETLKREAQAFGALMEMEFDAFYASANEADLAAKRLAKLLGGEGE